VSEKRSATCALLLLLLTRSSRLDSARHVTSHHITTRARRGCGIEPRSRAYLFTAQENRAFDRVFDGRVTTSRFGSLPDRGLLYRLGRATWAWPTLPRVSPLRRLYKLLPGYRRNHPETDLGFCHLSLLAPPP
jgi:hypothetical protein